MQLPHPIETDRLILKTPTWSDVPDLYRYASNPEVALYVSWHAHTRMDESYRFIARMEKMMEEGKLIEFGIYPKEVGHIIGTIGLMPKPSSPRAEVGYCIDKPYWGRGLVSEALQAVIQYGFTLEHIHRIEAIADETNIGSWRVMEKCGMERDALMKNYFYDERHENPLRNAVLYSILKPDNGSSE